MTEVKTPNEAGFTLGPWSVGNNGHNISTVYSVSSDDGVASVFGVPMHTRADEIPTLGTMWAEGLANARLVAAAPDLYEACCALVEGFIQRGPFDEPLGSSEQSPIINDAVAALAKARGEL